MSGARILNLMCNLTTRHLEFDLFCARAIVEHAKGASSIDGHDSMLTGLNRRA